MKKTRDLTPLEKAEVLLESTSLDSKNMELLLRKKIVRILKTISLLTEKQSALKVEIRRQKAALLSRRNELKKVRSNSKISAPLTAKDFYLKEDSQVQRTKNLERSDSILLVESAKILETF